MKLSRYRPLLSLDHMKKHSQHTWNRTRTPTRYINCCRPSSIDFHFLSINANYYYYYNYSYTTVHIIEFQEKGTCSNFSTEVKYR